MLLNVTTTVTTWQLYLRVFLIYELDLQAADQSETDGNLLLACLLHDLFFAINKAADVLSNAVNLVGVLSALSAVCLRR